MFLCMRWSFFWNAKLFSSSRGCCLALLAAAHAGGQLVHHGPYVGADQAPWQVLWAFKVTKSGKFHGIAFRRDRADQAIANERIFKGEGGAAVCLCCESVSLNGLSALEVLSFVVGLAWWA